MKRATRCAYLAIDLGASSGRVVLGTLEGDVMRMLEELHRFLTPLVEDGGHLYWDIESDVGRDPARRGARRWITAAPSARSRWTRGRWTTCRSTRTASPLRRPYSYRDPRTTGRMERAIELAGGADALYDRTGIQFLSLNTLPQVIADIEDEPELVRRDGDAPAHRRVLPVSACRGSRSPKRRCEHDAARRCAHAARGRVS